MDGRSEVLCPGAPIGLYCTDDRAAGLVSASRQCFNDCFNSHGAGDFAVGFAPHAVGKHEEVERLDDLVAIFVVRTHATNIGHAATYDSHTNSPRRSGNYTPAHARTRQLYSHANRGPRPAKALNPTDYSLFRYMGAGGVAQPRAGGACIAFIGMRLSTTIPRMSLHRRGPALLFACLIAGVFAAGLILTVSATGFRGADTTAAAANRSGERATLAVLDVNGRLTPGVTVISRTETGSRPMRRAGPFSLRR